jgi:dipeptidyl aminopeptidase/acylaminoacyl peptidase
VVSEGNLTQNISLLRKLFLNHTGSQDVIITHSGRGYQFTAKVIVRNTVESQPAETKNDSNSAFQEPTNAAASNGSSDTHPASQPAAVHPSLNGSVVHVDESDGRSNGYLNGASEEDATAVTPIETAGQDKSKLVIVPQSHRRKPLVGQARKARLLASVLVAIAALGVLAYIPIGETWDVVANGPHVKGAAWRPVVSPDGTRTAFVSLAGPAGFNALYIAPIDGNSAARLPIPEGRPNSPAWSPDGKSLAFVLNRGDRASLAIYEFESRSVRELITISRENTTLLRRVTWMPDGQHLILATRVTPSQAAVLLKVKRDGSATEPITDPSPEILGDYDPHVSADGRYLSFVRALRPITHTICERDLVSGTEKCLENGAPLILDHVRRPDSSLMVVLQSGLGGSIHELPAGWSPRDPLSPITALANRQPTSLDLGPDGRTLILSDATVDSDIVSAQLPADTSPSIDPLPLGTLLDWRSAEYYPQLSYDGKLLSFLSTHQGELAVWVLELASGRLTRVTSDRETPASAIWSKTGQHLLIKQKYTRENMIASFGQFPVFRIKTLDSTLEQARIYGNQQRLLGVRDGKLLTEDLANGKTSVLFDAVVTHMDFSPALPGILYTSTRNDPVIYWRKDAAAEPQVVVDDLDPQCHSCWTIRDSTLYYLRPAAGEPFHGAICEVNLGVSGMPRKCVGSLDIGRSPRHLGGLAVDASEGRVYFTRAGSVLRGELTVLSRTDRSIGSWVISKLFGKKPAKPY